MADQHGIGFSSGAVLVNRGSGSPQNDSPATTTNSNGGGGWGYTYGYGGGSYGSGGGGGGDGGNDSGPSDEQKQAAENLGAIVGYNAGTLRDKFDQSMQTFDLADEQNENLRDNNLLVARQQAGNEWFRQHRKLQGTASALNDRAGNAMRGSYLYDYRDLLGAADDMIDSETLDTQRQNENSVLQSYFESAAQNNVSRQEAAMDTESALRELYADYAAQLNNIHPDLAKDVIDAKGHTLKGTDWLGTDWFDGHKRTAIEPSRQGLYRPDAANATAVEGGTRQRDTSRSSAVMRGYWDRMDRGYDQRTRQA